MEQTKLIAVKFQSQFFGVLFVTPISLQPLFSELDLHTEYQASFFVVYGLFHPCWYDVWIALLEKSSIPPLHLTRWES